VGFTVTGTALGAIITEYRVRFAGRGVVHHGRLR
jgi:hypothetical protein